MNIEQNLISSKISQDLGARTITNAGFSIASLTYCSILELIVLPILINHLGDTMYGLYVLVWSVAGTMGILQLGLGDATLKYVAEYYARNDKEGMKRTISSTLFLYTITGLLGLIFLYFAAPWLGTIFKLDQTEREIGITVFRVTGLLLVPLFYNGALEAIPKAFQRYDISAMLTIIGFSLQMVPIVILAWRGYNIVVLVWAMVLSSMAKLVLNVFVIKLLVPDVAISARPSLLGIKQVLRFGVFCLGCQILGLIWFQANRYLVGGLIGVAAVAYLSVPVDLTFRLARFYGLAGNVLFPIFSAQSAHADKNAMAKVFSHSTWAMTAFSASMMVPLGLLMPDLLRLWVSKEFALKASFIGQLVAYSCIVRGAFIPYENLFKGIGRPHYLTILYVATTALSLTANVVFIPWLGLKGSAYCYWVSWPLGFVAIYVACRKILGIGFLPTIKHLFHPLIIAVLLAIPFHWVLVQIRPLTWLSLLVLGTIMFAILWFMFLLTDRLILGNDGPGSVLIFNGQGVLKALFYSKISL